MEVVIEHLTDYAVAIGCGLLAAAFIVLIVWAASNSQPSPNCHETSETRVTWNPTLKIPQTQHKWVCTTEEWRT